jgi:hypothetical protein
MPSATTVSDTRLYAVRPNQPIELNVRIGDGQAGGTSIMFKQSERPVEREWEPIGALNEDLANRVLHCITTVHDVNAMSNRTSVIYTLRGGVQEEIFPYEAEVSAQGDARYVIDFVFVR